MPKIAAGASASFSLTAGNVVSLSGALLRFEFPTGTVLFEGDGAEVLFGPYAVTANATVTSLIGGVDYAVTTPPSALGAYTPSNVAITGGSIKGVNLDWPDNTVCIFGDSITGNNWAPGQTAITGIAYSPSTGLFTATFAGESGLVASDQFRIFGASDVPYQGTFVVQSATPTQTVYALPSGMTAPTALTCASASYYYGPSYGAASWFAYANAVANGRMMLVNNAGTSGDATTGMALRLAADITAYRPAAVVDLGGINDIPTSTAAQVIANDRLRYAAILRTGAKLIVGTITPWGSGHASATAANIAKATEINNFRRQYAQATRNCYLWDAAATITDPASANGYALANTLADGIHPSAYGAQLMAVPLATIFQSIAPERNTLPSSQADSYAVNSGSSQYLANPLMQGTAGTKGSGITGNVPTNWGVTAVAGGTAVCSVPARTVVNDGDTVGNNLNAVCTFAATSDAINFINSTPATNIPSGTYGYCELHLSVSGMTNLSNVYLFLEVNDPVRGATRHSFFLDGNKGFGSAFKGVLRTNNIYFPTGYTSSRVVLSAIASGAGGATVAIGRAQVRAVQ